MSDMERTTTADNAVEEITVEELVKEVEASNEIAEQEEEYVKPYTLRKLKDADLFPFLQILKKIGIRDFKPAFIQVASGKKTLKDIGILATFDMVDILVGNLTKAEDEIYALWSDISGIPVEEMKEMEFGTLPMMIYDSITGVKDTGFFKVLSKLL